MRTPGARLRRTICISAVAVASAGALGCSSSPAEIPALGSKTATVSQSIIGGDVCTTCQWPSAVHNPGGDNCTNTLVAPNLLMSAGHCYDANNNAATVAFGEDSSSPGMTAEVDKCYLNPGYTGSVGNPSGTDISFCTLKTPITNVPITPILMGCETSILQPGQDVVLAGFGATAAGGMPDGKKRFVHVKIDSVDMSSGTVTLGDASTGACFGDSGGPAYVKLKDGTWRVFGATSQGAGTPCQSASIYTMIHPIVPWVEKTSGIDVTPCFNADGTWNPGPQCGKFPTDPDSPPMSANWANGCSDLLLSPTVSTTCGPNPAGGTTDGGTGGGSGSSSGSSGGGGSSGGSTSSSGGSGGAGGSSGSSGGSGGSGGGTGSGGSGGPSGSSGGGSSSGTPSSSGGSTSSGGASTSSSGGPVGTGLGANNGGGQGCSVSPVQVGLGGAGAGSSALALFGIVIGGAQLRRRRTGAKRA